MKKLHHARSIGCLLAVLLTSTCGGSSPAPTAPSQPTTPPGTPTSAPPAAIDAPLAVCPSAADLATLANLTIEIDQALKGGTLVCRASEGSADMNARERSIYRSLLFLRQTEFDAPLPWTNASAWTWLTNLKPRVRFILSSDSRNCFPCSPGNATLNITFSSATAPANPTWRIIMGEAAVLVHEARHIEVGGHPCGTNDNRADDLKAFGAHYYYRVWVERHTSAAQFPSELRAQLATENCQMRDSAFCNDSCSTPAH